MSGSFLVVLLIILLLIAFWRMALLLVIALVLTLLITGIGTIGGLFDAPTAADPRITVTTDAPAPASPLGQQPPR
jgi:hypothetical protein